MRYIFKGLRHGFPDKPQNYLRITIRAHGIQEAHKKAQKEAEMWHLELKPNEHNSLIWEQQEVKHRKPKPKNKHPTKAPSLNKHQLNDLVKQIETTYRTTKKGWNNQRLGLIQSFVIRKLIWKHKLGFVCRYCLVDFRGRYCCPAHSKYYRAINWEFYGRQYPWAGEGESIDHIKPISMGGLEFDKDNLQWMSLAENIRKGGINRVRAAQKRKVREDLNLAVNQAYVLWRAIGFGQKLLKEAE